MPHRDLLILTGPPGVGKTTVSESLAADSKRSVLLELDWFWHSLRSGKVEPWLSGSRSQNAVVMAAAAAAMCEYALGGYHVVAEGILGPWYLPQVAQVLDEAGVGWQYVVLRAPLDVCLARARARRLERGGGIDDAAVTHMWSQFADLGDHESHVLDTDGLTVQATCDLVLERMALKRMAR